MNEWVNVVGLAQACRDAGLEVWELGPEFDHSGNGNSWRTNEQAAPGNGQSTRGYYWTNHQDRHAGFNGVPLGHTVHHTASSGYTPYVKSSSGKTKMNVLLGMRRGNRLYQEGGGVPTLAFCSAGPADYSAGANNDELIRLYLPNDRRFEGPQRKRDTPGFYGNRYVWGTECVGRGDGSPLEAYDLLVAYCTVWSEFFEVSAYRNHGHYDLTGRKIDPNIQHGPYSISAIQDAVALELEQGDDMYAIGPGRNLNAEDVSFVQYKLLRLGYLTEQQFKDSNGNWTPVTNTAVRNFQSQRGHFVDGIVWGTVGADMDIAFAQSGGEGSCDCIPSDYAPAVHGHDVTTTGRAR